MLRYSGNILCYSVACTLNFALLRETQGTSGHTAYCSDDNRINTTTILDAVGNTPLIYLKTVSEETGRKIYGKAEFMNPSASVKDRAAKQMILDAQINGTLLPGGLIVEGTGGNTGKLSNDGLLWITASFKYIDFFGRIIVISLLLCTSSYFLLLSMPRRSVVSARRKSRIQYCSNYA
jgi:hypothetical protein